MKHSRSRKPIYRQPATRFVDDSTVACGASAYSLWVVSTRTVSAASETVHDDVVSEYSDTHSGVRNRGDVEFALNYIEDGSFGTVPGSIHEKAFHIFRLPVANHPFVDANKRTALNTTVVFYFLNGYRFEYDDEILTK